MCKYIFCLAHGNEQTLKILYVRMISRLSEKKDSINTIQLRENEKEFKIQLI